VLLYCAVFVAVLSVNFDYQACPDNPDSQASASNVAHILDNLSVLIPASIVLL